MIFKHIYLPRDSALIGTITLGKSGHGSNSNKRESHSLSAYIYILCLVV